jgi:hypothetical protein
MSFGILYAIFNQAYAVFFNYDSTAQTIIIFLMIIGSGMITFFAVRRIQRNRVKKAEKGS